MRIPSFRRERRARTNTPAPRTMVDALEARLLLANAVWSSSLGLLDDHDHTGSAYYVPQQYIRVPNGYLTAASNLDPLDIVTSYLTVQAGTLGLSTPDVANPVLKGRHTDPVSGLTHIYLAQRFQGLEIANANFTATVTSSGQLLNLAGGFVSLSTAGAIPVTPAVTADAALQATAALGLSVPTGAPGLRIESATPHSALLHAETLSLDPITARLQYLATADGIRLAWNMPLRTPDNQHWYDINIDAVAGTLLDSFDWTEHASYNVLPIPVHSPQDGPRTIVTNPADTQASPFGWHDTNGVAGAEYTDTRGNNVFAQEDTNADNTGGFRPDGTASLNFDFPLDLTLHPSSYQPAAITNLFYWNNVVHDILYKYGFTEAAGNFQVTNYSGQGLGNDPVQADAQDGSGTNNANFATPPDGSAPRMQMFLFTYTSPTRDGDFDNRIIVHEYVHGLSNRLTGGPSNSAALSATQSRGMGEGWSDWYSLMLTQKTTDTQYAAYGVGTYALGHAPDGQGIRRFRYSYDMAINPLTIDNYGTSGTGGGTTRSTQVHNVGEIWCSALWDINWLLINKHGFDDDLSTGYTGPGSAGNKLALRLVTDAMKIQPANPSFKDARDAILQADQVLTGGANKVQIWTAFARRGMGHSFVSNSSTSTSVTPAYDLPQGLLNARVETMWPVGVSLTPIQAVELNFSKEMDPASFTLADDVLSFTSPAGADVKNLISTATWKNGNQTLRLEFASDLATNGAYTLVIGSDVTDKELGEKLDQNGNGIAGEPGDNVTALFRYDALPGAVVSMTPADGTQATTPVTTIDLQFNEPFDPATLAASDLTLSRGTVVGATALNATTARFTVANLTSEGPVTVTLPAGALADAAGNPFLAHSGTFVLDVGTTVLTGFSLAPYEMGGRQLLRTGTIGIPADTDIYELTIDPGQTLAVVLESADIRGRLQIHDGNGTLLGDVSAAAVGGKTFFNAGAVQGKIAITVSSLSGTGAYTLRTYLNIQVEPELFGGPTNDTRATAQPLTFTDWDIANLQRAVVQGRLPSNGLIPLVQEDFEGGVLPAGWVPYSSVSNGRIRVTNAHGAGSGSYALIMDSSLDGYFAANDVTWTVDLSGQTQVQLTFKHAAWGDDANILPAIFTGHASGDGIAISVDGNTWHRIWDASTIYDSPFATQTIDLAAAAAARGLTLSANFRIRFHQADEYGVSTDGRGYDAIALNVPGPTVGADYYSTSLAAGESLSAALQHLGTAGATLKLFNDAGALLAQSSSPASGYQNALLDFVAPAAGVYYILVDGTDGAEYFLTATRNATLQPGLNYTSSAAIPVLSTPVNGVHRVVGRVTSPIDSYAVKLAPGGTLKLETYTPFDASEEPANTLNPRIQLFNADNNLLVAQDDNSAPDGRNARLSYTSATGGNFYISIDSSLPSTLGEYVLTISGNDTTPAPFTATSSIANGTLFGASPGTVALTFNSSPRFDSIDAADLLLNGNPLTVVSVSGNVATFTLPTVLPGGKHTLTLNANVVQNLQNVGNSPLQIEFEVDQGPPVVVNTTLQRGDTRTAGNLTLAVTFSEPMRTTNLSSNDIQIKGQFRNNTYNPTTFVYSADGETLNVVFSQLPDDIYTLTLLSGSNAFEDVFGNDLDGEALTWPIGPNTSGDGVAGGNFVISDLILDERFALRPSTQSQPVSPAQVYTYLLSPAALHVGDSDAFTLDIDEGQQLSLVLLAVSPDLQTSLTVLGPDFSPVLTATSSGPGQTIFANPLPTTTAGTYTVVIKNAGTTVGGYALHALLNAVQEHETHGGPANNTIANAQSLDNAVFADGTGKRRVSVSGGGASPANDDYYALTLTAGESISLLASLTSSMDVALFAADGTRLAYSIKDGVNLPHIDGFTAPADGTYYIAVTSASATYTFSVAIDAALERESASGNNPIANAQPLNGRNQVWGFLFAGDSDHYSVDAAAGDVLDFRTFVPALDNGQPTNSFFPKLELYTPAGTLLASDAGSLDGRNSRITYTVPADGRFIVRVLASTLSGAYALQVTGDTALAPFTVTSPIGGSTLTTSTPALHTVNLNRGFLATSVAAGDLLITNPQGNTTSASNVTFTDGDTLGFTIPAGIFTVDGVYTVSLAAGSITDLAGQPLQAYSYTYTIDRTGPRIIGSTLLQGDIRSDNALTLVLTFDEPINTTAISSADYALQETAVGLGTIIASSQAWNADGTVLTINYPALKEGAYRFTAFSNSSAFMDKVGNQLDGERNLITTVPTGNGTPGGNFIVEFAVDSGTGIPITTFSAVEPLGTGVYRSSEVRGYAHSATDVDSYLLTLDAGQSLSLHLHPFSAFHRLAVTVSGPGGAVIQNASAPAAGAGLVLNGLPVATAGTYLVEVRSDSGSGIYSINTTLNANLEREGRGGPSNDTTATAEPLTLAPVGTTAATTASVLARNASSSNYDYYALQLNANQTLNLILRNQTSGLSANLNLYNANGLLLATGTSAGSNVSSAITAYKVPSSGTYYVRAGGSVNEYLLTAYTNATFSLEANDSIATAQQFAGPGTIVGYVQPSATTITTIPAIFGGWWDSSGGHDALNSNYHAGIAGNGVHTRNFFVFNLASFNAHITAAELLIYNPSSGFSSSDPTETYNIFHVSTPIATLRASGSARTDIFADLADGADYGSTTVSYSDNGRDVRIVATTEMLSDLNAARGGQFALGGALTTLSASWSQFIFGFSDSYRANLKLDTGAEDDYYAFPFTAGRNYVFTTTTPADGLGQYNNTLDPALQILDADGNTLASDSNSAPDGRNATLHFTPAASGTFYIRVRGENNSRGEYVLNAQEAALTLALPADLTEGQAATATLSVTIAPAQDLEVFLTSTNNSRLQLPASVTIPAGQTSASFQVTAKENALLDGVAHVGVMATSADASYKQAIEYVEVLDNESATLTLTLPASLQEGAPPATAILTASAAPTENITIHVGSFNTNRLTVPATVTLLAGQTSVSFPVTAVNNNTIDGDTPVTVSAEVPNWNIATGTINILDNDRTVTITAPLSGWEGQTVQGTITLAGASATPTVVTLSTDDPTEISMPATVTVPAGQLSTTFSILLSSDLLKDGTQTPTLTASAPGFTPGSTSIQVRDSNLDSLAVTNIPSPQRGSVAFGVTVKALNIAGQAIVPFTLPLNVSATGTAGALTAATDQGTWLSGTWTAQVTVHAIDSAVVLRFANGSIHADSNPINVQAGPFASFRWSTPPAVARVNDPFTMSVTARDAFGYPVTTFSHALEFSGSAITDTAGILISEVSPGTPDYVEFTNVGRAPVDISGWQVYLYHNTNYPTPAPVFTFPAGTLVPPNGTFVLEEFGASPGIYPNFYHGGNIDWTEIGRTGVLLLNNAGNFVDFMAASNAYSSTINDPTSIPVSVWSGDPVLSAGYNQAYHRFGNADNNKSSDWKLAPPSRGMRDSQLTSPFPGTSTDIPIAPTRVNMVNGVWTGSITVLQAAPSVILRVEAPGPLSYYSSLPFQVAAAPKLLSTTIGDGSPQRSMINNITLAFDTAVILQPGALALVDANGISQPIAINLTNNGKTVVVTFTSPSLIGGSLDDGRYTFTIKPSLITDTANNPMHGADQNIDFHRYFGDIDGDEDADASDYNLFRTTYGKLAGQTGFISAFDYNGDLAIDTLDNQMIRARLGRRV